MLKILTISIFVSFLVINCSSSNNKNVSNETEFRSPQEIYIDGNIFFNDENYEMAKKEFLELTRLYPLSNEAIQSEIMIAFISYLKMDYDTAILEFKRIIRKYPSHKDLDYVYYMIAMCNYEQITHEGLDGSFNELSLNSFQQILNRFPESKYSKDSRQKIILIQSNYAAKHMHIGRYYLKEKKYTAALNRFKIVVEEYSSTKFTPEALHRMVEAYFEMGMVEESIKTASTLGYNYPNSVWYKYSYELINKTNKNDTFIKKITNLF